MGNELYISVPCTFEDNTLTIKGLRLSALGDTPEKALLDCIKNTVYYSSLKTAKIINFTDFKGKDFIHLEVAFSNLVYDAICDIEPSFSETKIKKQIKSFITEPSNEEILKLGY